MKEKKDVMSVKDVAEYYGVSQSAIYRLRDENKLHQLPLPGVKFGRQEVEALAGIEWEYSATGYKRLTEDNLELLTENRRLKEENKDIKFYATCGGIFIGALVLVDLITSISLVDLITR